MDEDSVDLDRMTDKEKMDFVVKGMMDLRSLKSLPEDIRGMKALLDGVSSDVATVKKDLQKTEENVGLHERRIQDLENKCDYLENYAKRENLVFRGIEGSNRESAEDCKFKVMTCVREMGINIFAQDISRAHRVKGKGFPKPILVRFVNFEKKEEILRNKRRLKGSSIIIFEDFSGKVIAERRVLLEAMEAARKEGLYAVVQFNKLFVEHPEDKNKQRIFQADVGSKEIKLVGTRDRYMVAGEDSGGEKEEEKDEAGQNWMNENSEGMDGLQVVGEDRGADTSPESVEIKKDNKRGKDFKLQSEPKWRVTGTGNRGSERGKKPQVQGPKSNNLDSWIKKKPNQDPGVTEPEKEK